MARIRTLKPEFWTDEKLAVMVPITRLVFLGLISQADDNGRLVDNVKLLDGMLFPYTDDTCSDALNDLASLGRIIRYRSESGQPLIQIANWDRHQKVKNPSQYTLPAPPTAKVVESTPKLVETPPSDPRSPIPDPQTPTADPRGEQRQHRAACVEFVKASGYGPTEKLIAEGEDTQLWKDRTGAPIPWDDRLRLLRLADGFVQSGERQKLRAGVVLAIQQQLDPYEVRKSNTPKPGTDHAAVRSEYPRENHTASTAGLVLLGGSPPKQDIDLDGERVSRWEADNPEQAQRMRAGIAARVPREFAGFEKMAKGWAESEFRKAVLELVRKSA